MLWQIGQQCANDYLHGYGKKFYGNAWQVVFGDGKMIRFVVNSFSFFLLDAE